MPYRFFHDPSHGWLEVPTAELRELGIAGRITHYSYISPDGTLAYLEEDCDMSTFVLAWARHHECTIPELQIDEIEDREGFVRRLPHYPGLSRIHEVTS